MNCKEANELLITDFLYSKGIEPKKVVGNSYWYLSPLREERTPSFKVDTNINRWFDHGMGIGGKLVDLGIRLYQVSVTEFLDDLNGYQPPESFSFQQHDSHEVKPTVKKVKALENKALLEYLHDRGIISSEVIQAYCQEVYYTIGAKHYFAIATKNDLGGYEVRNKYFKGCIGSKGITTFAQGKVNAFALFEGFMDFLSAIQEGGSIQDFSFIILHSVNQIESAIAELRKYNPEYILSYFDNDDAGRRCFGNLKTIYPNAIDRSTHYKGYKDFNEMIMQTKIKNHG
jgi:hypothetical protein